MMIRLLIVMAVLGTPLGAGAFTQGTPIATDSRIKTFVYNENDVYRLLTYIGYQLNVEFGKKEHIQTISVGDRTGWQIIPSGQRLFIRAMEKEAHTNMTVVTNKRAYQFDLYSAPPGKRGWDELVYVVRFYYPEDERKRRGLSSPAAPAVAPLMGYPTGGFSPDPGFGGGSGYGGMSAPPSATTQYGMAPPRSVPPPSGAMSYGGSGGNREARDFGGGAMPPPTFSGGPRGSHNYNYSFTGDKVLLPNQMFDDGRQTYLQYSPGRHVPQLFAVTADGREQEMRLNSSNQYLTVPGVYSRLTLRQGGRYACIYNEMRPQL